MSQNVIWAKPGFQINEAIQRFLAGDDVTQDLILFPFDIAASKAHAMGLERIGILNSVECRQLLEELEHLSVQFENGEFLLDSRFEDGHGAIEHFLTDRLGDIGRKIHTGRSRNDQVLVATRL